MTRAELLAAVAAQLPADTHLSWHKWGDRLVIELRRKGWVSCSEMHVCDLARLTASEAENLAGDLVYELHDRMIDAGTLP